MFGVILANSFAENYADCIMDLQKAYCPNESVIHYINREELDLFHALNDGLGLLGEYTIKKDDKVGFITMVKFALPA